MIVPLSTGLTRMLLCACLLFLPLQLAVADADEDTEASGLSLITANPDEGFALAVTLARRSVTTIQTDRNILFSERPVYAGSAEDLIAASAVIAAYFDTIAAANGYWRD